MTPPPPDDRAEGDLARLLRWERAGGTWQVVGRTPDALTLALLSCDAGEEMARLTSADPQVTSYVGEREASDG